MEIDLPTWISAMASVVWLLYLASRTAECIVATFRLVAGRIAATCSTSTATLPTSAASVVPLDSRSHNYYSNDIRWRDNDIRWHNNNSGSGSGSGGGGGGGGEEEGGRMAGDCARVPLVGALNAALMVVDPTVFGPYWVMALVVRRHGASARSPFFTALSLAARCAALPLHLFWLRAAGERAAPADGEWFLWARSAWEVLCACVVTASTCCVFVAVARAVAAVAAVGESRKARGGDGGVRRASRLSPTAATVLFGWLAMGTSGVALGWLLRRRRGLLQLLLALLASGGVVLHYACLSADWKTLRNWLRRVQRRLAPPLACRGRPTREAVVRELLCSDARHACANGSVAGLIAAYISAHVLVDLRIDPSHPPAAPQQAPSPGEDGRPDGPPARPLGEEGTAPHREEKRAAAPPATVVLSLAAEPPRAHTSEVGAVAAASAGMGADGARGAGAWRGHSPRPTHWCFATCDHRLDRCVPNGGCCGGVAYSTALHLQAARDAVAADDRAVGVSVQFAEWTNVAVESVLVQLPRWYRPTRLTRSGRPAAAAAAAAAATAVGGAGGKVDEEEVVVEEEEEGGESEAGAWPTAPARFALPRLRPLGDSGWFECRLDDAPCAAGPAASDTTPERDGRARRTAFARSLCALWAVLTRNGVPMRGSFCAFPEGPRHFEWPIADAEAAVEAGATHLRLFVAGTTDRPPSPPPAIAGAAVPRVQGGAPGFPNAYSVDLSSGGSADCNCSDEESRDHSVGEHAAQSPRLGGRGRVAWARPKRQRAPPVDAVTYVEVHGYVLHRRASDYLVNSAVSNVALVIVACDECVATGPPCRHCGCGAAAGWCPPVD